RPPDLFPYPTVFRSQGTVMARATDHVRNLDSAQWRECERLVGRFEEARRRGEAVALEDHLPAAGALRLAVLVELIHTDLQLRLGIGRPHLSTPITAP